MNEYIGCVMCQRGEGKNLLPFRQILWVKT